ncbi:hypothetical protein ACFE04_012596 [Oxalis oulophora]
MSSFSGEDSTERDEQSNMSGFQLYIGGQIRFEDPVTYVGGLLISDWDITPDELSLPTLNNTIDIMDNQQTSSENVWENMKNRYKVNDVEELFDEDYGSESEEEMLDDVGYGSEVENNELNDFMKKAKGYVENVATVGTTKRNENGELVDDDSDSVYSVGEDYEDDPDLNWSLDGEGEEALRKELETLGEEDTSMYRDLYTNYIPKAMMCGRDLWPSSDLVPLAAPPPKIQKGRPGIKRKPEPGIYENEGGINETMSVPQSTKVRDRMDPDKANKDKADKDKATSSILKKSSIQTVVVPRETSTSKSLNFVGARMWKEMQASPKKKRLLNTQESKND